MCSIDLEPCSLWDEREVRARKRHVCDCCHGLIEPGTIYVKHFSICDGDPTSEKCCAECKAARVEFADADGHMMATPSYSLEMLRECVAEAFREDWTDEDKRWRVLLAGMYKRRRAARMAERKARA